MWSTQKGKRDASKSVGRIGTGFRIPPPGAGGASRTTYFVHRANYVVDIVMCSSKRHKPDLSEWITRFRAPALQERIPRNPVDS